MSAAPEQISSVFDFELPERPYPGLRPFSKEEWPIFFGRERMFDEVYERLMQHRLLVIHGDSGCGKSSLIRAGLLPRLEQQFARGGLGWLTCTTTPGYDPLGNLASALASLDGKDDDGSRGNEIRRILNCGREGAAPLAEHLCGKRREHVCVLLDQFEELFAHARRQGPQQAGILIDLLIGVQKLTDPRLRVVLTMRSEFLGACAQYEGFAQTVNETQYLLPRMERADLMRAIQEPAILYDGTIAPDLAERLISDARGSQDQLPLIQHALMVLHRNRSTKPGAPWRLTADAYPKSGGLGSLLSDHADEVAHHAEQRATDRKQSVVEEIFRALTEMNADRQAIRRPQTLQELLAVTGTDMPTLTRIIDAFRAEGVSFLRPYGSEPLALRDSIDISHEALIRCWQKIDDDKTGWLAKEFDDGLIWSSLLVQCKNFAEDPQSVLSAATTEERQEWLAGRNQAWAVRYGGGWERVEKLIAASVVAREEQKQAEAKARQLKVVRRGLVVTSSLLLLTILSTVVAYTQYKSAVRATKDARNVAALAQNDARQKEEEIKKATDKFIAELAAVKQAANATPANSAIRQSVDQADASILQQVTQLRNATRAVQPRIYLHIAAESQRRAARIVELGIESATVNGAKVIVPGIQIASPPPYSLLRCFIAEECKQWGPVLLELVNRQLLAPRVELQDFSGTYTDTGKMRSQHFELYFAAGEIVTVKGAAKAY